MSSHLGSRTALLYVTTPSPPPVAALRPKYARRHLIFSGMSEAYSSSKLALLNSPV